MIQALEKRLAQVQQQVARASTQQSAGDDDAARSTVQTLTAEASAVSSALQTAQAELAQAMLASGKTTGLVSAQA